MNAENVVALLIVAVVCWLARSILNFAKEMTEWRIVLFGAAPNYENGMRGDIKALREDVDSLLERRAFIRRASDL